MQRLEQEQRLDLYSLAYDDQLGYRKDSRYIHQVKVSAKIWNLSK